MTSTAKSSGAEETFKSSATPHSQLKDPFVIAGPPRYLTHVRRQKRGSCGGQIHGSHHLSFNFLFYTNDGAVCVFFIVTVSVAFAAFRGESLTEEQLRSITSQAAPPSEVVVFDDASDDGTIEVVQDFASELGVRVVACRQPRNRGLIGNFESAIQATTGDIVFLSDQDDVWYPHKIAKVLETFDRNPAVELVFSDADLVDKNLRPLGRTPWQSIGFSNVDRDLMRSTHAFDLLLRRFLVTGATLAFRRSLLDVVLPLSKHLIHDAWNVTAQ